MIILYLHHQTPNIIFHVIVELGTYGNYRKNILVVYEAMDERIFWFGREITGYIYYA